MGVPVGHPFFGNQYTDGGYNGTFTYEVMNQGVGTLKTISNEIGKDVIRTVARQKSENPAITTVNPKSTNRNVVITFIISLAAVISGTFIYKQIKKNGKIKKEALQSIALSNVGTCTHCGAPLNGSTYVPENEADSTKAFIVCKNCGEKNFARYLDDIDLKSKNPENHLE